MTERLFAVCAAGLGVWLASVPVLGHHAISAKFDSDRTVTFRGLVSKIDWLNPHAHLFVDVTESDGTIRNWAVELESPADLRKSGWNRDSLQVGDEIEVEGIAARDGDVRDLR